MGPRARAYTAPRPRCGDMSYQSLLFTGRTDGQEGYSLTFLAPSTKRLPGANDLPCFVLTTLPGSSYVSPAKRVTLRRSCRASSTKTLLRRAPMIIHKTVALLRGVLEGMNDHL